MKEGSNDSYVEGLLIKEVKTEDDVTKVSHDLPLDTVFDSPLLGLPCGYLSFLTPLCSS